MKSICEGPMHDLVVCEDTYYIDNLCDHCRQHAWYLADVKDAQARYLRFIWKLDTHPYATPRGGGRLHRNTCVHMSPPSFGEIEASMEITPEDLCAKRTSLTCYPDFWFPVLLTEAEAAKSRRRPCAYCKPDEILARSGR